MKPSGENIANVFSVDNVATRSGTHLVLSPMLPDVIDPTSDYDTR